MNLEKLQNILDDFKGDVISSGEALDEMCEVLLKGTASDIELVKYITSDETSNEGDDYLTDFQCVEMIVDTYGLI